MLPLWFALAISYTLHAKDVFQPPKPPPAALWTAEAPGGREAVEFRARDGSEIRGWLYRAEQANAPFVLFFYGSNEDVAHEAARLAWLRDSLHVNAVCFDYPGYGFSTGRVDVGAIRAMALDAFDDVRDHLAVRGEDAARHAGGAAVGATGGSAAGPTGTAAGGAAPIVVYAWSIGSGLAVHVAAERRVAGVMLQAPPASAEEMAAWSSRHDVPRIARGMVKVAVEDDVRPIYDNAKGIAGVRSPLLIVQGENDDVVPIAQGREVFAASPAEHKRFVEVPGVHHNDLRVAHPPASDAVELFLREVVAAEGPGAAR